MNKEQESLIASGLWLLIKNSNEIEDNEKLTWMNDFDKLFGEITKEENCCEMPEEFVSKVNEIINDVLVSNSEVKEE